MPDHISCEFVGAGSMMLLQWLSGLKRDLWEQRYHRRRRNSKLKRLPTDTQMLEERVMLSGHSLDGDPSTHTVRFKDGFSNEFLSDLYSGTEDTMLISNIG